MGSSNNSGLSVGQQADSGMVGHRHGPPRDDTNFAGQDPNAVYTQVQAADPGQVGQVAQSWSNIGDALNTVNQVLSTGASSGASGWSGAAADRALQFHTQVAQWTAVAAQGSYQAGGNVAMQSNAASTAKYAMPKPMNYGMSQALADFAANPFDIGAIQNKLNQAQANHQQITHTAQQYDASLNQASQQMPALGPTPTFTNASNGSGNQSATVRKSGNGQSGGSGSGAMDRLGTYRPGGGQANPGRPGGSGQPVTPGPVPGPVPGPGQGTGLSGFGPGGNGGMGPGGGLGPGSGPGGPGGPGGFPGGVPGGGMMPIGPGGFGGGGDGFGPGGSRAGGFGGDDGPGGGGRAGGGRAGGFGGGRNSGFGPEGSGGAGGRSAAGALSAAEEAAASGAAGPAGAAGQPGAMGAGRGRKGADDQEHKRPSYLVERDPDSIFGVDEMTAPPVIGG